MKAIFLTTFAAVLLSISGISQAETVSSPQSSGETIPPILVGDSLRIASTCVSSRIKIKVFVTEDFLQGDSLVLLNLALTYEALLIEGMAAVKGELTINEETQSFEYVLTHAEEVIARFRLHYEDGAPDRFSGDISFEGWDAVCS